MQKLKFPVLLILLSIAILGNAMKYQIKCLNTPTITINQQPLKVGDWFNEDAVINWDNDSQAMRVLGEDNKVYTLSAKRYRESKSKKFSDFIALTKPMASRGLTSLTEDLQDIFENQYEILDEIHIDLSEIEGLPDDITFLISSDENLSEPLSLKPENGMLIIKRQDLKDISPSEGSSISLIVKFTLTDSGEEIFVTNWFELWLLLLI